MTGGDAMKKYLEWVVIVVCVFVIFRLMAGTFPHWRSMLADLTYNTNALLTMIGGG